MMRTPQESRQVFRRRSAVALRPNARWPRRVIRERRIEWHDQHGQLHRENGPAVEWTTDGPTSYDSEVPTPVVGRKEWYQHGKRHRDGGPAITHPDGYEEWWLDGELHRDQGPAVYSGGRQCWYRSGQLHRTDGPALIIVDNVSCWYLNGELHRDGGPAIEYWNGSQEWWQNGELHRDEGPAIVYAYGRKEWYRRGVRVKVEFASEGVSLAVEGATLP